MRYLNKFVVILFVLLASFESAVTRADELFTSEIPSTAWPHVGPAANPNITNGELAFNFASMYAVQWGMYILTQRETIADHGSFNNWATNWCQPHFDNDTFQYNIFKHSIVGQGYYQFYRSRGYELKKAFLWAFASSLAFEMAIETTTEKPSLQDIYQTPVYGTILGIGLEKVSQACHRTETALGHICGYILDPFTLLPSSPKFAMYPEISHDKFVANVSWVY